MGSFLFEMQGKILEIPNSKTKFQIPKTKFQIPIGSNLN